MDLQIIYFWCYPCHQLLTIYSSSARYKNLFSSVSWKTQPNQFVRILHYCGFWFSRTLITLDKIFYPLNFKFCELNYAMKLRCFHKFSKYISFIIVFHYDPSVFLYFNHFNLVLHRTSQQSTLSKLLCPSIMLKLSQEV